MSDIQIKEDVFLKDLTTLRIGGKAKGYVEVGGREELAQAIRKAKEKKLNIFVLGGGSDILVSDSGINALVVKYVGKKVNLEETDGRVLVEAEAGLEWDDLVEMCVNQNLQGVECLSGIPGTVGAAPIQNIGAYGQELRDTFKELVAYEIETEKFIVFTNKDCNFGYRESFFKKPEHWQKYVIVSVTLVLAKNDPPTLTYDSLKDYLKDKCVDSPTINEVRTAILKIREGKFEDYKKVPNAGSFFKNPIVGSDKLEELKSKFPDIHYFENNDNTYKLFAGWLIEKAGWKGKILGNARVSSSHALILLNPDSKAMASEIRDLSEQIVLDIYKKFGIRLENEVQFIGFNDNFVNM